MVAVMMSTDFPERTAELVTIPVIGIVLGAALIAGVFYSRVRRERNAEKEFSGAVSKFVTGKSNPLSFRKFCLLMTLLQVAVFGPITLIFMMQGDGERAALFPVVSSICLLIGLITVWTSPALRRLITNQPGRN
jgi:hypothetical protein